MKDKINSILSEVKTKISEAANENELQNVKNAYVGKQGALSMLMKELPKLDAALRPEMGKHLRFHRTLTVLYRESCRRTEDFPQSHRCAMT